MAEFLKTDKEIKAWLDKYDVENYTLIPDDKYGFVINIEGSVNLSNRKLQNIPVKFNEVAESFYCYSNQLSSLEFCPTVIGGDFDCLHNQLISLEFCPHTVVAFYCQHNLISSLEFFPQSGSGYFNCSYNRLLGIAQTLHDFQALYRLHKESLIKKEKDWLSQTITPEKYSQNKNTYKI